MEEALKRRSLVDFGRVIISASPWGLRAFHESPGVGIVEDGGDNVSITQSECIMTSSPQKTAIGSRNRQ